MLRLVAILALAMLLSGCADELAMELANEQWGCTQSWGRQVPLVAGPNPATSQTTGQTVVELEDGEDAIDFLEMRAHVELVSGDVEFFATGPDGQLDGVEGQGSEADPWIVVVAAPLPGEYEWGVRPAPAAVGTSVSFGTAQQHGNVGDYRCDASPLFPV